MDHLILPFEMMLMMLTSIEVIAPEVPEPSLLPPEGKKRLRYWRKWKEVLTCLDVDGICPPAIALINRAGLESNDCCRRSICSCCCCSRFALAAAAAAAADEDEAVEVEGAAATGVSIPPNRSKWPASITGCNEEEVRDGMKTRRSKINSPVRRLLPKHGH